MVESFIKKYQSSNDGNFPSLNLTHKEVGGSFYTVREIVREIIQENRVLGPVKLTLEEQNADSFFEQYPLGSISMESHIHVVSSNEPHIITTFTSSNHQQNTNEVQVLDSGGQYEVSEHWKLDDGIIINGSTHAADRKQEFSESVQSEPPVIKVPDGEENMENEIVTCEARIPQITTDVMVETFPLRPVNDTIFALDGDSGKSRVIAGTSEEKELENMGLGAVNNGLVLDTVDVLEISSNLVDEKADANAESPISKMSCVLVDDKTDPSLERPNHSAAESSNVFEVNDDTADLDIKEISPAETKHISVQNGIENPNGNISSSSEGQPISEEVALKRESGIRHSGRSLKASDPTLDRINLESWEATADRSNVSETNSLLGFVKAFITAFVKFWSE